MQNLFERLTAETKHSMATYSDTYPSTTARLKSNLEGLNSYLLLTLEDTFTLMSICNTRDVNDINTMFN